MSYYIERNKNVHGFLFLEPINGSLKQKKPRSAIKLKNWNIKNNIRYGRKYVLL